jgi:glycosyltransferase involved in cell wall biosynthesis
MKLTCIVQIYNELEKDNLPRFIRSVINYCDALIVYDDGSTDGGIDYLAHGDFLHSQLTNMYFIHGEKNNFSNEIEHKQKLLDKALEIESDWIFWLDGDERLEPKGELGGLRNLCETATCDAYGFREVNLWRSPCFYRLDNSYNDGEFCRLWRNTGKLYYDVKLGLHQRQYPHGIGEIKTSDIKVIHYGFSSDFRIIDKYKTYLSHGQTGWALHRLIDESTLRVARSKPEWFIDEDLDSEFEKVFSVPVATKIL